MSAKRVTAADEILQKLALKPLPGEGGYFRETYRSNSPGLNARSFGIESDSVRKICTAIYYLVTPESFSALHRIKSDEVFHFYAGDPVEMIQIDAKGRLQIFLMGSDVMNGQVPQVVVPRGDWQGLRIKDGGKWALLGTTVAPGFEFEDFELGERSRMSAEFPRLKDSIDRYTRESRENARE